MSLNSHLHGWVSVLSAGFVQEVTPSHTYCVGDGAGFVVQK